MKNVYSFRSIFIFLTFLAGSLVLASCSNDSFLSESSTESATGISEDQNTAFLKLGDILPINSTNPYDSAGRIHNELFETYFELQNQPQTLAGIVSRVDSIANAHSEFTSIKSTDY